MGGSHDVAIRKSDWEFMGPGHFLGAWRGEAQKMAIAPRVNNGSVVVSGAVGGN